MRKARNHIVIKDVRNSLTKARSHNVYYLSLTLLIIDVSNRHA